VASLQSRLQFGAIFVSDGHGEIAGTLPMSLIKTENSARAPDIIVSFSYDETTAVAGKPGVSYASSVNRRGDHGSFSPSDVHISLMARGPDFKAGLRDPLPSANVDIAPTVARILGFSMPDAQGRVLEEAIEGGPAPIEYALSEKTYRSSKQAGLLMKLPTDLDGRSVDPKLTTYLVELKTKFLTRGDANYTYFDQARAVRE
jgi:arylsulfatase A-like enzyme